MSQNQASRLRCMRKTTSTEFLSCMPSLLFCARGVSDVSEETGSIYFIRGCLSGSGTRKVCVCVCVYVCMYEIARTNTYFFRDYV